MPEATPEFKQQLREAFDSILVGQAFTFRRTFTEGDVALFCGITGDYNPYHIDETFTQSSWFGRRIIPGLLTSGMMTHIGGLSGGAPVTVQWLSCPGKAGTLSIRK